MSDSEPQVGDTRPCFDADCGGTQTAAAVAGPGNARVMIWRCPRCGFKEPCD